MLKKISLVGVIVVAALGLTACEVNIDTAVNSDGTGQYTIYQEGSKSDLAQSLGVPEDEVVTSIESTLTMPSEEMPEGYSTEIEDLGDNVGVTISTGFTYDATGWSFLSTSTSSPQGAGVFLDESGESATFTFDTANLMEGAPSEVLDMMDWRISVTFPDEITNVTGNGKIDGNTVTWTNDEFIPAAEGGTSLEATGTLGDSSGGADEGPRETEVSEDSRDDSTPAPLPGDPLIVEEESSILGLLIVGGFVVVGVIAFSVLLVLRSRE